jgi:hypothetical protein
MFIEQNPNGDPGEGHHGPGEEESRFISQLLSTNNSFWKSFELNSQINY